MAIAESRMLVPGAGSLSYVELPGARNAVVFFWRGGLLAQALDRRANTLIGEPVPFASRDPGFSGLDSSSASSDGRVVAMFRSPNTRYAELVELNRTGDVQRIVAPLASYLNLSLSPDGEKIAEAKFSEGNLDLWVHDITRGSSSRLTSDPAADGVPVWSADGRHVAFATWRNGVSDIYVASPAGTVPEQPLIRSSTSKYPCDWSHDGSLLVYEVADTKSGWDLWTVAVSSGLRQGRPLPCLLRSSTSGMDGYRPTGNCSRMSPMRQDERRFISGSSVRIPLNCRFRPQAAPSRYGAAPNLASCISHRRMAN